MYSDIICSLLVLMMVVRCGHIFRQLENRIDSLTKEFDDLRDKLDK